MYAYHYSRGRLAAVCLFLMSSSPALAQWQQDAKLMPKGPVAGIEFGNAVSISGNVAALGAHLDSEGGLRAGSAYVFYRDETDWLKRTKLIASDAPPLAEFGFSVSVCEDLLVVGAPFDSPAGSTSGSVYVFRDGVSGWVEEAKLIPSDAQSFDQFGTAVAVGHGWVLAGAPCDDDLGSNSGSAYFFLYDGQAWVEDTKLTANGGVSEDRFGATVALDGDVALIGAPRRDAGAAYVFRHDGSSWTAEAELTASNGSTGDRFGASVALCDGAALLGAPRYDSPAGNNVGAAYLFRFDGDQWVESTALTALDATSSDYFGISVAVTAGYAVVGAHFDDDGGTNSGSVYMYRLTSDTCVEEAKLTAADGALFDMFGAAVALGENRVLIGAIGDDDAEVDAGSTYVFALDQPNDPPACDAGVSYTADWQAETALVLLDGSRSSDPDGDELTYRWTTDCPDASFDDPNSAAPVLAIPATPECQSDWRVTLTVSDDVNPPVSCDAVVTVRDATPPVITCPADAELVFGESLDPAALGSPEVEDADPDVALSFSDSESRSDDPAGAMRETITRTWTATDACGNSSSCEQTITVWRLVLPLDIKPGDCPNAHNPRSNGYLPVAILGTPDLDVRNIDPASIRLGRADGVGDWVAPHEGPRGPKMTFEDVAAAGADAECECRADEPDGIDDLVMKFSSPGLEDALELSSADRSAPLEIVVTGAISDPGSPLDGATFTAFDCLRLVGQGGKKGDKDNGQGRPDELPPPFADPCGAGAAAALPFTLGGLALLRVGRRGVRRIR